jgi:hypothetical protein
MSSKTKSAVADVSTSFRPAGVGMHPQRHWMGCGHYHTRGKLRHGVPWTCAKCVEAKGGKA